MTANSWHQLPSGWETKPAKYGFSVLNGATPSSSEQSYWDGDIHWATPEDIGSLQGRILRKTRRKITEAGYNHSGTQIAPEGSIVLTTRAPVGNLALSGIPLCTNQGCKTLVPRSKFFDSDYFYYQFLARKEELGALATGTTFQELGTEELRAFEIWIPSISEQRAIADFLDRETAKIDELISEKERLLELLAEKRRALVTNAVTRGLDPDVPVRNSGVEWLGEIPQHWEAPPVYARYDVVLGKMLDEKKISGAHLSPYLRNFDVQWHRINVHNLPKMDFHAEDKKTYSLKKGDVLICEGGEIGRTAIWQGQLPECYYQKALHRLRPITALDNPEFFAFVMEAVAKLGVFAAESNQSTIQHLTAEKLRVFRFPSPPLREQGEITTYVRSETGRISDLYRIVERTIRLLGERRTALISAAVAGRVRVEAES